MVTVNSISAAGGQNQLTFNTAEFNVIPNGYEGLLKIGLEPALGTSNGSENETLSAHLVPGLDHSFSIAYHSDFIIHTDEDDNVTSDNPAAASCYGYF